MSQTTQLLRDAVTHHQAGRLNDAENAYRKLLTADAANADALRLLGGLYIHVGQRERAVECLEQAARLLPNDLETQTNFAIALRGVGRTGDAEAHYHRILDLNPDYVAALNNRGALYADIGRLVEAQGDYGRVVTLQPDNAVAHFNYGNVLMGLGREIEAIARYEHALKLKGDYLDAMINLGMALCHAGNAPQGAQWLGIARSWFDKALAADPNNIMALNNIGNVLRQQGKPEEAVVYYRRALALRPDYVQAVINFATSLRDLNQYDEAIDACRAALRLKPDSVDARINLGALLQDQMRHNEAVQVFTEALVMKPSSIDARWNMSLSLLALGNYREGWKLHEIGLGVAHMRGQYPSPDRRWNGEDITGKRLLIWCEQGLGDDMQFVRYAELCKARGATVIVSCPRPVRRLFSHCPFIDELPDSIEEKNFDVHVPMMSLPYVLNTTLDTIPQNFPYLRIGDDARAAWASKFPEGKKFKVGLVWAGNPREHQINAHMADRKRSMTLDMLRPLLDVPGVQFYNLQFGDKAAQIDEYGLRERFIDLMGDVKDFEDTGAIVEHLDLVISVDTSVVHLVGGMGRPVWILSRFDACWRWLRNRSDSPWYPSAHVFGQKTSGDWTDAIVAVREALQQAAVPKN